MALDDDWMSYASCRGITDPEVFFPPKRKGVRTDYSTAKKICYSCPVRRTCLAYAIAHNIYLGVWGGLGEGERKAMDRQLKLEIRRRWWVIHPLAKPSRPRREVSR
jgi:WhiB family redox-sensing transcriptional regulator